MGAAEPPANLPDNFTPPALFDVVKELNAHAGRLATLLGLIVAASSFSLTNGPIHDALLQLDFDKHALLYGCVVSVAMDLFGGAMSVLYAMDPALPATLISVDRWQTLIKEKTRRCARAKFAVITSLIGLFAAWSVVYSDYEFWPCGIPARVSSQQRCFSHCGIATPLSAIEATQVPSTATAPPSLQNIAPPTD